MRVEEPFHPLGRRALGQVLVGQLVHRGNERAHAGDRLKAVAIGLALVEARIRIEHGHQEKRQHRRNQHQERQIGEVGQSFKHVTLVNRVVQDCTGSPETDECHHDLR